MMPYLNRVELTWSLFLDVISVWKTELVDVSTSVLAVLPVTVLLE